MKPVPEDLEIEEKMTFLELQKDEEKKNAKLNELKQKKQEKEKQKRQLKNKDSFQDDTLFTKFFKAVINQETDYWKELCRLVKCKYSIHVNGLKDKLFYCRQEKDAMEGLMHKKNIPEQLQIGYRANFEKAKAQFAMLEKDIEEGVIDQEQFFRESHLKVQHDKKKSKVELDFDPEMQQTEFYESLARMFEQGQSLEIIDGDLRNLEQESLSRVMEFV